MVCCGSVIGGYYNWATGRFANVLGGSRSHAAGRHSFTIGSYGRAAGDYSGVINLRGQDADCTANDDNELVICAEAVRIVTSSGSIDLTGLERRLSAEDSDVLHHVLFELKRLQTQYLKLEQRLDNDDIQDHSGTSSGSHTAA